MVKSPLKLSVTPATARTHANAIIAADDRYAAMDMRQLKNASSSLRYRLLGASCAKRKRLRAAAVKRQGFRCVPCGEPFNDERKPVLQFKVRLTDGGKPTKDNSFAACEHCQRQGQIAQAAAAWEGA